MTLHETLNINLRRINKTIEDIVRLDRDVPASSVLSKSILALIRSGGKRLRPLMVVVGSRFGTLPTGKLQLQLAAAAEFIHASSLIHDDIIDQSDMRRGQSAMHTITGVSEAVHIGSYMSARVIELLSSYSSNKDRYIHDLSAVATAQLCLGEYEQLEHRYDYDLTLEQYLEKSRNKTAQLMATCLRVGALSTEADPGVADLLYTFGEHLGMSFQIQDDLLDFTQTPDVLGKPSGSDLIQGQVTLPVIYALQRPELAPTIRAIHSGSTPLEIQEAISIICSSGALQQTEQLSHDYLNKAQGIIEQLSSFPAHHDLQALLDYFAGRDH
ncbi:polyprenyl synthetase family protein [Paenibacillus macquariensis]|uniref:Heptaprenyl diphosphate synthase n=1 Tax=Paenibacillus macquariensis TaxID=948756 RepID=A0ABY1K935_9BACL|nr:polyprenyl synthetase family protein [Paenibacillus macquariensis]MEC0091545.1 polyprenyl synthetase family protein [Paenibacillus macquariensis]OAB26676.1 heptaprenyl diphosphate synthase [Paenibacillus macquariensis subsp. macquariensis]SIR44425.1 heptaprenyl diphosphate synthase [Paenibacillus macquariensis]